MTEDIEKQAADLRAAFESYGEKITTAMGAGVEAACLFVEGEARKKAPVDTGLLRGSITHTVEETEDKAIGYVGTATEYAPYIEFGTGKYAADGNGRKTPWFVNLPLGGGFWTAGNRPQPFLTPAVNENRMKIQEIIQKTIAKVLK